MLTHAVPWYAQLPQLTGGWWPGRILDLLGPRDCPSTRRGTAQGGAKMLNFGRSGLGAGCLLLPLHSHPLPLAALCLVGSSPGRMGRMEDGRLHVYLQLLPYGVTLGHCVLPPEVTAPCKPPSPLGLSPSRLQ